MVLFYHIDNLQLGSASRVSGHQTYLRAKYIDPVDSTHRRKIIYKMNKHGESQYSRYEVMFSTLAQLFLSPESTPSLRLVVDDERKINKKHISGLAVEHLCYVIEKTVGLPNCFYTLVGAKFASNFELSEVRSAKRIPYYFLDKLPQGFFASLTEAEADGLVSIDYDSLAGILATSYTLEEDDLHKGNYGFYLLQRDEKPHAVFFKIDHDLMFVDGIMSYRTRRPFHVMHDANAFDITAEDLCSLTCLKHSSNSYWPSKFGYVANPFDQKEYHNFADIDAFVRLGTDPQFIKAKWRIFLKHILIPNELIKQSLLECSIWDNPSDRAEIALMTQTTASRLARLRAVLFSIPEFRDYVSKLDQEEIQALLDNIIPPQERTEGLMRQVRDSLRYYRKLCRYTNGFSDGDTPLHIAIKLGEYRYDETLSMFGQFIDVKNEKNLSPLDIAVQQSYSQHEIPDHPGCNALMIMKNLSENGAHKTKYYRRANKEDEINAYQFINPYLEHITKGMRYIIFRELLRDIGEDHRFSLKFKKNLACECIERYIDVTEDENKLLRLRDDINGYSADKESAGLKYIRQLRSRLWIVRQIRGLYGLTSTQWQINTMIGLALERIQAKEPGCFSFFSCKNKRADAPLNHEVKLELG